MISLAGACRREELCKIKISDTEEKDSFLIVKTDTKTNIENKFVVLKNNY